MFETLYIVGVGAGDPELITLKALKVIEKCKVVAGWQSVVSRFNLSGKELVYLNYKDQDRQIPDLVKRAREQDVAILDHGDPSVSDFQFIGRIRESCRQFDVKYEVIPGISSVLKALALVERDLSQVVFMTFHIRGELDYTQIDKSIALGRDLLIIPEPYSYGVKKIAERLVDLGLNPEMVVMERLSFTDEKVNHFMAKEILDMDLKFSDMSIVYVKLS
ncbi:cobalt-precorrin-6Y C(5)-methyltransferase [Sulfolobus acidocaldarius SUSAZ]|nr:cobalt-precorrin-6Y C(5)-methyltransferase [Sulfolobus acidocaldarius SUSAZ]